MNNSLSIPALNKKSLNDRVAIVFQQLEQIVQKISRCVYSIFQPIADALIHSKTVNALTKIFSYKSFFGSHQVKLQNGESIDRSVLRTRTDVEGDDCAHLIKKAIALNQIEGKKKNPTKKLDVIVSLGDDRILSLKIDTIQNKLCEMVAEGLMKEGLLSSYRFVKDATRGADPDKVPGYENIHAESLQFLQNPQIAALKNKYFGNQHYLSIEELHLEFAQKKAELAKVGIDPIINELSIAPVDDIFYHYEANPDEAKCVNFASYGSFNFLDAIRNIARRLNITQEEAADRLAKVLNSFNAVFDYEAFISTRFSYTGKDGKPRKSDFNRIGSDSHPDIFKPLLQEDRSPLQKFIVEGACLGWTRPIKEERIQYFQNEFGEQGAHFVEALEQQIAQKGTAFTVDDAFALYPQYFQPVPEGQEPGDRKTSKKISGKLSQLHNFLINKYQMTLSDYTLSEILAQGKKIISPSCLSANKKIAFEKKDGRINTIFVPAGKGERGPVFALESRFDKWKGDLPGIKASKLIQCSKEFFASLRPQKQQPAALQNRARTIATAV